ncbi:MAG: hypothetical protein AMXMBFR33_55130 [Candidatus Xenobia bacterium]
MLQRMAVLLLALALAITPALAEKAMEELDERKEFEAGYKQFQVKNYKGAIHHFDRALKKEPGFVKAYVWRGASFFLMDDPKRSMNDLNKALELDPENEVAIYFRGGAYFFLGDSRAAIKDYTRFLKFSEENAQGYFYRALSHYRLGEIQPAISDASRAIEFNPKNGDAFAIRGGAYMRQQNYSGATRDFEFAVKLQPDNPTYQMLHYVAQARSGNTSTADLQKFAATAPQTNAWPYPALRLLLGKITPEECIAEAQKSSENEVYRTMAVDQANFYAAQYYTLKGDAPKATEYMTMVEHNELNLLFSQNLAKYRLARLEK